jgi:hypothetical protein
MMVLAHKLQSKHSWGGLYGIIMVLCAPEIILPVFWNSYIFAILAMLIVTAGFVQVPLTWVLLGVFWRKKSVPRQRKLECTIAVLFATVVFLRVAWVALHFKT